MTTRTRRLGAALALVVACAGLAAWSWRALPAEPLRVTLGARAFELVEPLWLRGLALLPLLGAVALLSRRAQGAGALSTGLRALTAALLLLALARPARLTLSPRRSSVVLVDTSASVDDPFLAQARERYASLCRARGAHETLALVSFAAEARLVARGCQGDAPALVRTDAQATDIEGALLFALAQFEPDAARRIVLFSDGIETRGSLARAGAALRAAGVPVLYVPAPASSARELGIAQLELPDAVKAGAPFAVRASIRATHAGRARLRLLRDGVLEPDGERTLELAAGENPVTLRGLCRTPGKVVYRLELTPEGPDRLVQNNAFERALRVLGKPRVLYVERERAQASALRNLLAGAGFELDVRGPEGAPRSRAELAAFDFFILSDVPRAALPERSAELIAGFLEEGGGFLMAGGEQGFGLGGYRGSPFERILPVALERKEKHDEPTLALALVIDKSGSMNDEKIALAKEAARATASLLHEDDYLGVIGFDATPVHVVRMAAVQNRSAVERGIERLKAGGGTAIFPALDAAYADLSGVRARKKHVILLTDGQTRESGLDVLVQNMQLSDITLSTVGLGEDVSRGLLEELARLGHGRAYFTDDPRHVPRLFLHDTEAVARSAAIEADVTAYPAAAADFLKQVRIERAPPLRGYVATSRRAEPAQVVLETAAREPLLARMRVGLGWSLAFTSDLKPRWAASWFAWPDFSRLLAQLVREHMRAERGDELRIATRVEDEELVGRVDVLDQAQRFANGLSGSMLLRREPSGDVLQNRPLDQVGPGVYEARFPLDALGSYALEASLGPEPAAPPGGSAGAGALPRPAPEAGRRALGAATYAYPREYAELTPRPQALAELARRSGGGPLGAGRAPFRELPDGSGSAPLRGQPLWPALAGAALVAFLLDAASRRLWRRSRSTRWPVKPTG
jgi:Ca-activated chloride channel homolog